MSLLAKVPRKYKLWLKARLFEARRAFAQTVLSYDGQQLRATLRSMGIEPGDTVLLHSSFAEHHGFRGSIEQLTDVFLDAVGPQGHLLMVSLPYRTSTLAYLTNMRRFDVRHTPSMMGLVSELFRRRTGVRRSLSPSHPMLAFGPRADWFVEGHESCPYPCGPGTPFEKLVTSDAKAVFFNTTFDTYTFFHYLEHLVRERVPLQLYTDTPFQAPVIDAQGNRLTVPTYAFTQEAIRRRRFPVFEQEVRRRGAIVERRIGATRIRLARVRDTVECVQDMSRRGIYFYDLEGLPPPS